MNSAAIEARVAALEASNRRLRRGLLALGLGVVVLTGIGANLPGGVPEEIHAKAFVAVDDAGRPLVLVGRNPSSPSQGCVVVNSASPAGICAFLRGSETGEGLLHIRGNGGLSGVTLTGRAVTVNGEGGNRAVSLMLNDNGAGLCGTFNDRGQALVTLNTTVEGQGMVTTQDAKGQELVTLGVTDSGGCVHVSNKTGQAVCKMMVDEYGNGMIGVLNRYGEDARGLRPGP